jgi:2-dehydropantoate 2-reductase
MRHAILGAGGIGGLIGAVLGHGGHAITLILPGERLTAHPATLSLESPLGAAATRVTGSAALVDEVDALWVTVKATQLDTALDAVPVPERARLVVPLLNGVDHVRVLRERFGPARVVPATIACESERVVPGRIVHRSPFVRLAFLAADEHRIAAVADVVRAFGCECAFVADEATLLWRKLVFLAPVALTTSAGGMTVGEVLGDAAWRARLEGAVREACAVARASGAAVDPDVTLKALAAMPGTLRSSMSKDVAAGRRPELDAIAGPILRGGREYGIAVPVMEELAMRVSKL